MKLLKLFWVVVGAALVAIPTSILELLKPEPKTLDSSFYLVLFEPSTFHLTGDPPHLTGDPPSIATVERWQRDEANEYLRHRDNKTDTYVVKIAFECGLRQFRVDALLGVYKIHPQLVWIPISEPSNGALKCAIDRAIREKIDYSLLRLKSDSEIDGNPKHTSWDPIRKQ